LPGNAKPQLGAECSDIAELGLGGPKLGWYDRGYLPHFDAEGLIQFITFRLADSLPQTILKQLEQELVQTLASKREFERRKKVEDWLDAGLGCCALAHPQMAQLMQQTLQKFDGDHYQLIAWCIMPNHVHVLIEPTISLPKILQSWKSFTGRWAIAHNAELGLVVPIITGTTKHQFWMREYWDRYIRNEQHFNNTLHYIHNNPFKAGLCDQAVDWPWSSAYALGKTSSSLAQV